MNEEILKKIYNKHYSSKISYEQFKHDIQTPEVRRKIYNKNYSQKLSWEQFEYDLGGQPTTETVEAPQPTSVEPSQQPTVEPTQQIQPKGEPDEKAVNKPIGFWNTIKKIGGELRDAYNTKKPTTQSEKKPNFFSNAVKSGWTSGEIAERVGLNEMPTDDASDQQQKYTEIARLEKELKNTPLSDEVNQFMQAEGWDAVKIFAKNAPQIITEVTAQSMSAMANYGALRIGSATAAGAGVGSLGGPGGAAVGAGYGLSAGMAETEGALEYSGSIMSALEEAGVDVTNPESLREAFTNEELMSEVKTYATKRAVPIGVFSLVFGNLAGKVTGKPASTFLGKTISGTSKWGKTLTLEATGGAGGELTAQVVSGDDIDLKSVALEAVGELGTAPMDVYAGTKQMRKNLKEVNTTINEATEGISPEVSEEIDRVALDAANTVKTTQQENITDDTQDATSSENLNEQKDAVKIEEAGGISLQPETTGSKEVQGTLTEAEPETTTQEDEVKPKADGNPLDTKKEESNLQTTLKEAWDRNLQVTTEDGSTGKLVQTGGGKLELHTTNGKIAELGNTQSQESHILPQGVKLTGDTMLSDLGLRITEEQPTTGGQKKPLVSFVKQDEWSEAQTIESISNEFVKGDNVLFQGTGESVSDNKQSAIEQIADYLREKGVTGYDNVKDFLGKVSSKLQGFPKLTDTDTKEINHLLTVPKPPKPTRTESEVSLLKKQMTDVEAGYKRGNKDSKSIFKQIYDILNKVDLKRRDRINIMSEFNRLDIRNEQDVADFFNRLYTTIEGKEGNKVLTASELIQEAGTKFAQGLKEGVKKGSKIFKDQIKRVQEVAKNANMSPRQVSAILSKLRGYNPFSGDSGAKLSAFIDKVVNDSEYANKLGSAKNAKKKISKLKDLTSEEKRIITLFKAIDPSETDVDKYLEIAGKILASKRSFKEDKSGKLIAPDPMNYNEVDGTVREMVSDNYRAEFGNDPDADLTVEDMLNEIGKKRIADRVEAQNKRLKADGEGLFEDEIQLLLDDTPLGERQAKKTDRENTNAKIKKLAEDTKNSMPDKAPDVTEGHTQEEVDKVWENLRKIDLNLLTPEQHKQFINIVNRILANGDYGNSGMLSAISEAQSDFKELSNAAKYFKILKLGDFRQGLASLPQIFRALTGLDTDAALFQLYLGLSDIDKAYNKALEAQTNLITKLEELRKKTPKAFSNDALFRRGVLKLLVEYEANSNQKESLAKNKEIVEQVIATLRESDKRRGDKDAKLIEKLYEPFKKAETIDEVLEIMGKIDPQGLNVFNEIVNSFKPNAQKMKDYNYLYWGKSAPEVINYTGKRQYMKIGKAVTQSGFEIEYDDFKTPENKDYYKATQSASAMGRKKKVKRDDNNNILPYTDDDNNYVIPNLNTDGVAVSSIKRQVMDFESIKGRIKLKYNKTRRGDFVKMLAKNTQKWVRFVRQDPEDIANRAFDQIFGEHGGVQSYIETMFGKPDKKDPSTQRFVSFLNAAREIGYSATLGGYSQGLKQGAVMANVAGHMGIRQDILPKVISSFMFEGKEVKNFLKHCSVSKRESLNAVMNIGEFVDHRKINDQVGLLATKVSGSKVGDVYRWGKNWVGGIKPLTKADATYAEVSYLAFYRKYLAEKGIKFTGWERETSLADTSSRKQAHAYAKQMVDVLQTVSNPAEQGRLLKENGIGGQIIKNEVIPYGTFALNQKNRLLSDYNALLYGNMAQKQYALKNISRVIFETAVFKLISYGSRTAIGVGTAALMHSGSDRERDEEDEEYLEKERSVTDFIASVLIELFPSLYTSAEPVQDVVKYGMNEVAFQYHKHYVDPKITEKEYKDEVGDFVPMYAKNGGQIDTWVQLLGVYGAGATAVIDAHKLYKHNVDEDLRLTPEEKKAIDAAILLNLGTLTKLAPADVRFAVQKQAKRIVKRRKGTPIEEPKGKYEFILGPTPRERRRGKTKTTYSLE